MTPSPLRVLIAGGGVAAVETVLALRALAGDRVAIDVLSPGDELVERPWSVLTPFTGEPAPRALLEGVRRHHGSLAAVKVAPHLVTTADGGQLRYERLVIAAGARRVECVPGAVTFRGPVSAGAVEHALREDPARVVFVAPPGCGWTLPAYELALLAAKTFGGEVAIASHEARPLEAFGRCGSDAVARLLDRAGVDFLPGVAGVAAVDGALVCADGRLVPADAVIALPEVRPPRIAGLADGFLDVDRHGHVRGALDVFAAGDITSEPLKQGGLATQQADAVAESIAAAAGARVRPRRGARVLRAVLLTGEAPLYLRRDLDTGASLVRRLRTVPRGKVIGRYLSPFLAAS